VTEMIKSRLLHKNLSSSTPLLALALHTNSNLHKLIPEDSNQWVIQALAPPPHATWILHCHRKGFLDEELVLDLAGGVELAQGLDLEKGRVMARGLRFHILKE